MAIHRVAYWGKYDKYPELIRHKCNNTKCRNPDHLIKGNHRDNAIDKRDFFPKEFERKWLGLYGDVEKLTEYFGWKIIVDGEIKRFRLVCMCGRKNWILEISIRRFLVTALIENHNNIRVKR